MSGGGAIARCLLRPAVRGLTGGSGNTRRLATNSSGPLRVSKASLFFGGLEGTQGLGAADERLRVSTFGSTPPAAACKGFHESIVRRDHAAEAFGRSEGTEGQILVGGCGATVIRTSEPSCPDAIGGGL